MIMSLPFYISNFMSCFVKNMDKRHKLRLVVNCALYKPFVAHFVKKTFVVNVQSIKPIRQHTMGRFVCVVNDEYFVKVFRNMSGARLKNFECLVNYVAKFLDVDVPRIYISKNNHMYATKKARGYSIYDFDKKFVIKNEKKILAGVDHIISQLQSIDLAKIKDASRFCVALESTTKKNKIEPITPDSVLAHLDLNVRNFLFDKDLNICALIDFDSLCITNNKARDKEIFMKYWNRYKESN